MSYSHALAQVRPQCLWEGISLIPGAMAQWDAFNDALRMVQERLEQQASGRTAATSVSEPTAARSAASSWAESHVNWGSHGWTGSWGNYGWSEDWQKKEWEEQHGSARAPTFMDDEVFSPITPPEPDELEPAQQLEAEALQQKDMEEAVLSPVTPPEPDELEAERTPFVKRTAKEWEEICKHRTKEEWAVILEAVDWNAPRTTNDMALYPELPPHMFRKNGELLWYPPPAEGGGYWRNQVWRKKSRRFGSRGGTRREHFKRRYGGGRLNKEATQRREREMASGEMCPATPPGPPPRRRLHPHPPPHPPPPPPPPRLPRLPLVHVRVTHSKTPPWRK